MSPVRDVGPNDARAYLGKATEFLEVAERCLKAGQLNAAAGTAVHAGIAGADAISAAVTGKVWRGDHTGGVDQVKLAGLEGKRAALHLTRLLKLKNRAEYDPESSTPRQATDAVKAARRILDCAAEVFGDR